MKGAEKLILAKESDDRYVIGRDKPMVGSFDKFLSRLSSYDLSGYDNVICSGFSSGEQEDIKGIFADFMMRDSGVDSGLEVGDE
jgi:hypothetical protein